MSGDVSDDGYDDLWAAKPRSSLLHTISSTLVSVELQTDMRRSRLRQSSRRVILKASITSVILLSIAFIITYSVILTYISNKVPLMRHHGDSEDKSKSGKRTKLLNKPIDLLNQDAVLKFMKDKTVKWNVENFENLLTLKPQCYKEAKLTILITSAASNADRRKSIRETWCRHQNFNRVDHPWQCVFLIGQSLNQSSNILIDNEVAHHRDILIGSYIDSYRNLTIKIMHGLHWSSTACLTAYVLKTDDDVYINTQLLDSLLTTSTPKEGVYMGAVMQSQERLQVLRNQHNKWSVTMEEYPLSYYPPYAIGMGYILSADVVRDIVSVCQYVVPFANEDAYVGVLAYRLGLEPTWSGRFVLTGSGLRTCNLRYLVVIHHVKAQEQWPLFRMNQDAFSQCTEELEGDTGLTWS